MMYFYSLVTIYFIILLQLLFSKRGMGEELSLEKDLYTVVGRALKSLKVDKPASCKCSSCCFS